jgi:fermentation-respiration switch protein FrsA (DUF1100 family)
MAEGVRRLIAWPLVLVFTYGMLHFLAKRAIYYPMPFPQGFWELQTRLGAEDVWLRAADRVRIHGWWIPKAEARVATLYLHGNAGNITHRGSHIRAITAAGSAVLIIDYRGYGKSEGRPEEQGLYLDAEASYVHLLERGYRPEQIVAHGESLGSAVAVDLAARRRCGGLVLEAPFTSARQVAARVLPLLGPMLVKGFDSEAKIRIVRAPLLVIHGDRDEVIDQELGRKLFEAAGEPKTFWPVPGARHNDIVETAGPEYERRLREFYEELGTGEAPVNSN